MRIWSAGVPPALWIAGILPAAAWKAAAHNAGWKPALHIVWIAGLLLLSAGGIYFLSPRFKSTVAAYKNHNVLLITIDTLRADHLPAYGYTQVKTPNIDRLAEESLIFEEAMSHVPMTLPSHVSLLTGLLPIAHGVRENGGFFLDPKITTLAEILKGSGYQTAGFVSAYVLDSHWQIDQGFDSYFDNFYPDESDSINAGDLQRRAAETEVEVEDWLKENKEKRFFAWVHYFDPHFPYDPPEPYRTQYAARPYDGEIAYTDEAIGRLLSIVKELRLEEETIIILTSDHGEGLGEHSELTHALFIYNTTQHVPLLIRLPDAKKQRIKGIVSHIDIAPSILQWLGLSEHAQMQGKSLIPILEGKEKGRRMAYAESLHSEVHFGWSPLKSLITQEYKFIEAPKPELYDRMVDPVESKNLATEKPAVVKALGNRLEELIRAYTWEGSRGPQRMEPETEEKLRALGYVGTVVSATEAGKKQDPKDKVHLLRAVSEARVLLEARDYGPALEKLSKVLEEAPEMIESHYITGAAYLGLRQNEKAIDEFMKAVALRPDYVPAMVSLASVYQTKEDWKNAEYWFHKVLEYDTDHPLVTLKLAHQYRMTHQPEKANLYLSKLVQSYMTSLQHTRTGKERAGVYIRLGEVYFGFKEWNKAEESIKKALELTPDASMLHYNLGVIYEAKNDFPNAASEYIKETEINSGNLKAYTNLGILYQRSGQLQNAVECFRRVLEIRPTDLQASYLLAETYLALDQNLQEALVLARAVAHQNPESQEAQRLLLALDTKVKESKN